MGGRRTRRGLGAIIVLMLVVATAAASPAGGQDAKHQARPSPLQDGPRRPLRRDPRVSGREDRSAADSGHSLDEAPVRHLHHRRILEPTPSTPEMASTRSAWRPTSCPTGPWAAPGARSASSHHLAEPQPEPSDRALAVGRLERRPRPRPRQPPPPLLDALAERAEASGSGRLHAKVPRSDHDLPAPPPPKPRYGRNEPDRRPPAIGPEPRSRANGAAVPATAKIAPAVPDKLRQDRATRPRERSPGACVVAGSSQAYPRHMPATA